MAAGKPVIACTGQGIEEVIQHGKNGLLISPNSLPEIINCLVRTLESPDSSAAMGEEARQTMIREFTFARQAERLLRLYRECIA
jgi:glycosyltransferase involved in cell wall biosynthesis